MNFGAGPDLTLPNFPLTWSRWRFTLRCHTELRLDGHIGSRLAGRLGQVLRARHCTGFGAEEGLAAPCPDTEPECQHWPQCAYGTLIRTRARRGSGQAGASPSFLDVPRPLIVTPLDARPGPYAPGQLFVFDLTLLGSALELYPQVVAAVEAMALEGMGSGREQGCGLCSVEEVRLIVPPCFGFGPNRPLELADLVPAMQALRGTRLRVEFVRPARLLQRANSAKNPTLLPAQQVNFSDLWRILARRLQDLCIYSGGGEPAWPYGSWQRAAEQVRSLRNCLWHLPQERFSFTQNTAIDAGGCLGHLDLEGDLEPFLPLLVAGEWLHVGKNTDMGEGQYRLVAL